MFSYRRRCSLRWPIQNATTTAMDTTIVLPIAIPTFALVGKLPDELEEGTTLLEIAGGAGVVVAGLAVI